MKKSFLNVYLLFSSFTFFACQKQIQNSAEAHNVLNGQSKTEKISIENESSISRSLQKGLIVYYPFNGNTKDESGNKNDGIASNLIPTIDRFGKSNRAYNFNGLQTTSGSTIVCNNSVLNLGQLEYTIHIWFKIDNTTQITRCLFNTIPHTGIGITYNDNNAPGYMVYDIGPGNAFWTSLYRHGTKNNYLVGQWNCVTLTKSNTLYSIYINGSLEDSFQNLAASAYNQLVQFRISGINDLIYQTFTGDMDDIRIYNRTLTQSEITYLATH